MYYIVDFRIYLEVTFILKFLVWAMDNIDDVIVFENNGCDVCEARLLELSEPVVSCSAPSDAY